MYVQLYVVWQMSGCTQCAIDLKRAHALRRDVHEHGACSIITHLMLSIHTMVSLPPLTQVEDAESFLSSVGCAEPIMHVQETMMHAQETTMHAQETMMHAQETAFPAAASGVIHAAAASGFIPWVKSLLLDHRVT